MMVTVGCGKRKAKISAFNGYGSWVFSIRS